MTNLPDLPEDIFVLINKSLGISDIVNFSEVCKNTKNATCSSKEEYDKLKGLQDGIKKDGIDFGILARDFNNVTTGYKDFGIKVGYNFYGSNIYDSIIPVNENADEGIFNRIHINVVNTGNFTSGELSPDIFFIFLYIYAKKVILYKLYLEQIGSKENININNDIIKIKNALNGYGEKSPIDLNLFKVTSGGRSSRKSSSKSGAKVQLVKTGRTYKGMDGVERVVYMKNGEFYVKKKSEKTGKFTYRKVKV